MTRKLLFILISAAVMLGCTPETKKVDELSANIIRTSKDYGQRAAASYQEMKMPSLPELPDLPKMPDVVPEDISAKLTETNQALAENAKAISAIQEGVAITKEIGSDIQKAKEFASETKATVSETARNTKNTVRYYARGLPRSEKEANELVVSKAQSWSRYIRTRYDSFMRQHPQGIFRSNSRSKSKSKSK